MESGKYTVLSLTNGILQLHSVKPPPETQLKSYLATSFLVILRSTPRQNAADRRMPPPQSVIFEMCLNTMKSAKGNTEQFEKPGSQG